MSKIQISKQITTRLRLFWKILLLYSICQRYRFQSKLQPVSAYDINPTNCIQYVKDTDFKANYNTLKQLILKLHCIQYVKDTDFKANYNPLSLAFKSAVLYSICQRYRFQSKLQRIGHLVALVIHCIQYVKDTDFKANYNGLKWWFALKSKIFCNLYSKFARGAKRWTLKRFNLHGTTIRQTTCR